MGIVQEMIRTVFTDQPDRAVARDEDCLLAPPHDSPLPMKLWRDHDPLAVVHFPPEYVAQPFAPPRGVYESDRVRVEWQTMDNRQPFYHRNCDVDEISYQIAGDRTLMTELGVVEHRPGELSRLPRGVAHDNYGRRESHLLFYTPAPVAEERAPERTSEALFPVFPGWEPAPHNEAITQCLGAPEHDITVFPVDERLLLEQVHATDDRLTVLRAADGPGVTWFYRSPHFRLASVRRSGGEAVVYQRTLDADEIQYQVSGRRVLVSQRGIVELGPGDFVRVPLGLAHTSISTEDTEHLSVYAATELPQIGPTARTAEPYTPRRLAELRDGSGR
ncbi:hypothetical protein [Actinoplanes sp. NPDC049265]|uniref:hypothetical protein n=1 Tax=Actinoplanes sp. NPDC049265 TaxID=3363902 RepID=UPI003717AF4F